MALDEDCESVEHDHACLVRKSKGVTEGGGKVLVRGEGRGVAYTVDGTFSVNELDILSISVLRHEVVSIKERGIWSVHSPCRNAGSIHTL